ncbi:MAG TPA: dihydrofolate reductase family protein [Vicinamibacterales bacterium]|jgi:riboflavin biosynthesis pyrimidine reductase|nr:dihydrofolate reductase family protein [Vicinamibacterales bacterium]
MDRRSESFGEFVAWKEAEAARAVLSPFVSGVDQPTADVIPIGNAWTRRMFDGPFYVSAAPSNELPSTSLVFVRSHNGNTGAADPSSLGGGEADKHLIYEGLSRVAADAVMAGAETVRGGRIVLSIWHPELVALRASLRLPRHPVQIVATLRGLDFSGRLFSTPELRVVVVTVGAGTELTVTPVAQRPWMTVLTMPTARDLPYAFRQLREMGIARISCIGGRTIARQLIDAGLVQDLYVTTSAKEGGRPGTPLYPRPVKGDLVVRKRGTGPDEGVIFEHLRLTSG